jgi:uncharacterized protein (TIGR02217 family)
MFLESPRFPTDESFQHAGGPKFATDVGILDSGFEERNQNWPEARRRYDAAGYRAQKLDRVTAMLEFFELCGGKEICFRYRDRRDFLSCRITPDLRNLPAVAATDQVISVDTATQDAFQLAKSFYSPIKKRRRLITKPVTGTVLVAIQGKTIPSTLYDLDYVPAALKREGHLTTGRVTFAANVQKAITAISQAASARVTAAGHGLLVGYTVHFSTVGGMTQINGKRGAVTNVVSSSQFDVDIDSSGFSTYTSGGQINTRRQASALTVSVAGVTAGLATLIATGSPHNLVPGDIGIFTGGGAHDDADGVGLLRQRQLTRSQHFERWKFRDRGARDGRLRVRCPVPFRCRRAPVFSPRLDGRERRGPADRGPDPVTTASDEFRAHLQLENHNLTTCCKIVLTKYQPRDHAGKSRSRHDALET